MSSGGSLGVRLLFKDYESCSLGIPVVQVVAGPRVSTSTDEGFALALTDAGDVYSWGKGYKGEHCTVQLSNI